MTKYAVIRLNQFAWPIFIGVFGDEEQAEQIIRTQIAAEGRTIASETPWSKDGAAPGIMQKQFTTGQESYNSWVIQGIDE